MNTFIEPSQTTLYNLPQLPMLEIAGYLTPWGRVAWRVCSKQMKSILNPKAEVFLFNSLKLGIRSYVGDHSVERVQAFAFWLGSEKDQLRITNLSENCSSGPSDLFKEVIAIFPNIESVWFDFSDYFNLTYPPKAKIRGSLVARRLADVLCPQLSKLRIIYDETSTLCKKFLK